MSTRSTSTQPSTRPGQHSTSNLPRARSIPQLRRPQPTAPPPLPGPIPLGLSRTQSQVQLPLPRPTTSSSSNTNSKPKPKLQNLSRKPSIPLRPTLPPPRSTITRKVSSRGLGSPAVPAGGVGITRKASTSRLAVGLVGSPATNLGKGKKLLPARSLHNLGIGLPSRSKVNDAAGAGPKGRTGSNKDINPDSKTKMGMTAPAVPSRPARVASRPHLRDDRVSQDQSIAPVPGYEQSRAKVLGTDNVFYETDHHKNRIGEGPGMGMPMPIPPKEVFEARAGPLRRVISRGRGINRLNDLDMDCEQDGPMGATPSPTKRFELGTPILRPAPALPPFPKELSQYQYELKSQHPDVETAFLPQNTTVHLKDSHSSSPLPAGVSQYQYQDQGRIRVENIDISESKPNSSNLEVNDDSDVRHDTPAQAQAVALVHHRSQSGLQDSPIRSRIHSQPTSTPLFPRLMARGQVINFDHLPMIADASFSFTGDSSEELSGEELRIAELALERMKSERDDAIHKENMLKDVIREGRWKEVRGALESELERVGEFRGMSSDLRGLLGGMKA